MKQTYQEHKEITKELLDTIQTNDLVKVNDWKKPMKVMGVSDNYFVMIQTNFGKVWYSVCEKKPWPGIQHNQMRGGMFHCGRDNTLFGWSLGPYEFHDETFTKEYLKAFETEDIELSVRGSIPIYELYVKKARKQNEA